MNIYNHLNYTLLFGGIKSTIKNQLTLAMISLERETASYIGEPGSQTRVPPGLHGHDQQALGGGFYQSGNVVGLEN